MNFLVFILSDKLQICNVVVVMIEIAVVNVVTFGNFAVEILPYEAVNANCTAKIFADVFVELQAREFFLCVADSFNRWHDTFDLANHFFDGKRFLRRLDTLAQHLEKFFFIFHDNASKFLTNNLRDAKINV